MEMPERIRERLATPTRSRTRHRDIEAASASRSARLSARKSAIQHLLARVASGVTRARERREILKREGRERIATKLQRAAAKREAVLLERQKIAARLARGHAVPPTVSCAAKKLQGWWRRAGSKRTVLALDDALQKLGLVLTKSTTVDFDQLAAKIQQEDVKTGAHELLLRLCGPNPPPTKIFLAALVLTTNPSIAHDSGAPRPDETASDVVLVAERMLSSLGRVVEAVQGGQGYRTETDAFNAALRTYVDKFNVWQRQGVDRMVSELIGSFLELSAALLSADDATAAQIQRMQMRVRHQISRVGGRRGLRQLQRAEGRAVETTSGSDAVSSPCRSDVSDVDPSPTPSPLRRPTTQPPPQTPPSQPLSQAAHPSPSQQDRPANAEIVHETLLQQSLDRREVQRHAAETHGVPSRLASGRGGGGGTAQAASSPAARRLNFDKSSVEEAVEGAVRRAFWDHVGQEIHDVLHPQDTTAATTAPWLIGVLTDLQTNLASLCPSRTQDIRSALDLSVVEDQIHRHTLRQADLVALVHALRTLVSRMQAPARDEAAALAWREVGEGDVVAGLRLCWDQVEEIKRDMQQAHVDAVQPIIAGHGVEYLRAEWSADVAAGRTSTDSVRVWLQDALSRVSSSTGTVVSDVNVSHLVSRMRAGDAGALRWLHREAILSTVSGGAELAPLLVPDSLARDRARVEDLRKCFAAEEAAWSTLTLLQRHVVNSPADVVSRLSSGIMCLAATSVPANSDAANLDLDALLRMIHAALGDAAADVTPTQLQVLRSPASPLRRLIRRRLRSLWADMAADLPYVAANIRDITHATQT